MSQFLKPEEARDVPKEDGVYKVLIAIPNEGHTQVEAYANRLMNFMHMGKLEERLKHEGAKPRPEFYFMTMGRIFTPLAREEAASMAEDCGMDYLYMIDDDMIAGDDTFERLARHDVDIVAPLAFTRNYPHMPVMYSCMEGWDPVRQKEFFRNHYVQNYPKDQLVECDAVGFGAVLIKIGVIKAMEKPRFMSTCGTGEDVLFCYSAKKLGFRTFMDTSVKLGHLSHPINVTEEYVQQMHKQLDTQMEKKNGLYNKYEGRSLLKKDEALVVLGA